MLLDALLRHFPDGSINVFDRDLRYLYAAGAGHARLGLVPATLIGKRLDDLFPAGPVAEIRIHCDRAFAGEAVTFTLVILERTYIIRAWPLEEADGAINAIVAMAIEVPTLPGDGHERGVWRPRVGGRVRIRAEISWMSTGHELPHDPAEREHAGLVVADRPRASFPSHRYLVSFDAPVPIVDRGGHSQPLHGRHYAADELEPIG
jgi:hypothetical protein